MPLYQVITFALLKRYGIQAADWNVRGKSLGNRTTCSGFRKDLGLDTGN